MTLWKTLVGWFTSLSGGLSVESDGHRLNDHHCDINPANGLPMVGGCGGVDVQGNPYGTDWGHHDTWASSPWDNDLLSGYSSWDSGMGSNWND